MHAVFMVPVLGTYILIVLTNYILHPIAIRILFDLPHETHRYFIQLISECNYLKTLLCSRFDKFYASLCNSSKHSIRLLTALCKDNLRITLGKNLHNIALDC